MKSKRLEAICAFLDKEDSIIDIGCDHAYVPIEMAKRGCQKILATDIHKKALESALKNIKESGYESKISCALKDGLKGIDTTDYNTLVLAGLGFFTIQKILKEKEKLKSIKKIILQSNNNLSSARIWMQEIGYYLEEEKVVYEENHYYTIMKYCSKNQKRTDEELEFGILKEENLAYYKDLKKRYEEILLKIPDKNPKKEEYLKKKNQYEKYIHFFF